MYDVADYYDARGLLSRVDGRQRIDAVTAAISEAAGEVGTSGDEPAGTE
jgi:adenylate kinase family enzyme